MKDVIFHNNPKKIALFYGVLFAIFVIGSLIMFKAQDKMEEPYIVVRNFDGKIEGVINRMRKHRGSVLVDLKNDQKFMIKIGYNLDYEKKGLHEFLLKGDSIVKPVFSDTLYIYRSIEKYFFIIGKDTGGQK